MIMQKFHNLKYRWSITVFYCTDSFNINAISPHISAICTPEDYRDAVELMELNSPNTGFTCSDAEHRQSVVVIGPTTNAFEFQDTFDHEKGHLVMHMASMSGIHPQSEEYQYLAGWVGRQMFSVAKHFLCDDCRVKFLASVPSK